MWNPLAALVGCSLCNGRVSRFPVSELVDVFSNVRLSVKIGFGKCRSIFCTTKQKFFFFPLSLWWNSVMFLAMLSTEFVFKFLPSFKISSWWLNCWLNCCVIIINNCCCDIWTVLVVDSISLSICLVISPFLRLFVYLIRRPKFVVTQNIRNNKI